MRQVVCKLPLLLVALLVVFTIYSLHVSTQRDYQNEKPEELLVEGLLPATTLQGPPRTTPEPVLQLQKPERTNLFFLKAHKCASSTVQNIFLRFGLERGLTFVLPTVNNYIGNPEPFRADMIDKDYATPNGKYNIFTHHSRYNTEEVRSVMYDDAVYITILRHPAQLYESLFSYYNFEKVFNVTFEDLLKYPENLNKITKRFFNKIGFNQMSFDLGYLEEDFNSTPKVIEFIKKIEDEFDLVMMSEWMEASLVLLADKMNWPLENVMSLKLNSRPPASIYNMSNNEIDRVIELNNVDYLLYTHFLNQFRKRIKEYGEDRMKSQINKLLNLNLHLHFRCVQSQNQKGFGNTQAYKLRSEEDRLCYYAARGELPFTEEMRNIQKEKIKVMSRLEVLLNIE